MVTIVKASDVRVRGEWPIEPAVLEVEAQVVPDRTDRLGHWVEVKDRSGHKVTGEVEWENADFIQVRVGPHLHLVTTAPDVTVREVPAPKGRDLLMGR